MEYTKFSEYWEALRMPIGEKMKERILDHAANNPDIPLNQLMQLVVLAYPDQM